MGKRLLTLLLFLVVSQAANAQVSVHIDQEYVSTCLVDSLPNGSVFRFQRITLLGSLESVDLRQGAPYTPLGTIISCEDYDLQLITRDPLAELYPDCNCTTTISQEDHRVIEPVPGTQNFTGTYISVVRELCDGESVPRIIQTDTVSMILRVGLSGAGGYANNYDVQFNTIGDYVDDLDVRLYLSASNVITVTVDLNPSTVQASYPGLTLDANDFSWNGSNDNDIWVAYTDVVQHALEQAAGGPLVNHVAAFETAPAGGIRVFTNLWHQPPFPYAILPDSLDADFNVVLGGDATAAFRNEGFRRETSTSSYAAACGEIIAVQNSQFMRWDRLVPLSILPNLSPSGVSYPASNNASVTCAAPPELCASLADENECFNPCSEILNVAGQMPVSNTIIELEAGTYNSISIWVSQGPVQVSPSGSIPINYPENYTGNFSAAPHQTIKNKITVDATNGEAIITFIR